jgi:hypothetical protein
MENNIIIIPFALLWNWSADYERKTAEYLAKNNTVIAFLIGEGLSFRKLLTRSAKPFIKTEKGVYIFRPIYLLPFQRIPIIGKLNFYFAKIQFNLLLHFLFTQSGKQIIFWSFSLQYNVFPHHIWHKHLSLYECIDGAVSADLKTDILWKKQESVMIQESNIVITNSKVLYNQKRKLYQNVYCVPEGLFDNELFRQSHIKNEPTELKKIPHPRLAYVGNVNNRFDFSFIHKLANLTPSFSYIFIGKLDPKFDGLNNINFNQEIDKLRMLKNVYLLGFKEKINIPKYINYIDIGFIPYNVSLEFNKLCNPMKIQEYFYYGKPVIITSIPSVKQYQPYVKIVSSPQNAMETIFNLIENKWSIIDQKAQRSISSTNSITNRINHINTIILKYLSNKIN